MDPMGMWQSHKALVEKHTQTDWGGGGGVQEKMFCPFEHSKK